MSIKAAITLPAPISTNNLFSNAPGRGRVVTKEYAAWRKQAAQMIAAHAPVPRFTAPVLIALFVGEKGVGNMDSDNTAKAYLDALKKAGVIHDDSRKWVRGSSVAWVPGMAGCVAHIEEAGAPPSANEIIATASKGLRDFLR
ncbi:RusA family crossover junction endodeoxyribonuclease [Pararhodobacter sp.]|uniref:RusA family crossover junction endodeoxyribonuclease n=1 Tax=Pararhodobacter sp. TaxID=2127056 RepID=UPI002FDE5BC8